ncbi:MAG: hypothetical protein AAFV31_18020 [Pseudomonadota bacterium]
MLSSDLATQTKFSHNQCLVGPHYQPPPAATIPVLPQYALDETDIPSLADYVQGLDANLLVPTPPTPTPPEEPKEEDEGWSFEMSGMSTGSEDGGVSKEHERGIREYVRSGYTRRDPNSTLNPDGTRNYTTVDDDFGGKWDEEVEIIGGEASKSLFDESVAEGSFGTPASTFSGNGSILSGSSEAAAGFTISQQGADGVSPGFNAHAGADIQGSVAEGRIGTGEEYADNSQTLATGQAKGSVLSGEAEAKVEAVLNAEQATLGGDLGAEFNVVEGSIDGDLHITPRRVVNGAVRAYNWMFNDDIAEPLDENWDIGIMVGGELSGQVGAQAGAEAHAGYENGKVRAEAGVKVGLGLGAGLKARAGLVGVDKVWNGMKSATSSAWDWAWGN